MNKKTFLFFIASLYFTHLQSTITHIFLDPNVVFGTNTSKAAGYVGKWESIKFTAAVGSLPSQKHFFEALMPFTATSATRTYDEGLPAPFIISDWLLGASTAELTAKVKSFLDHSSLSKPEKKVHMNTVNMMFNGQSLAKVQKVRHKIPKLLKQLKQQGYKVHFVGNWANIQPLKEAFPKIFSEFDSISISSDIKQLKPKKEFWETVWANMNINPEECLCIEAEQIFYDVASTLTCKAVLYHSKKDIKHFAAELQAAGVSVSL